MSGGTFYTGDILHSYTVSQCLNINNGYLNAFATGRSSVGLLRVRYQNDRHDLLYMMVCITPFRQKCGEVPLSYSRSHFSMVRLTFKCFFNTRVVYTYDKNNVFYLVDIQ